MKMLCHQDGKGTHCTLCKTKVPHYKHHAFGEVGGGGGGSHCVRERCRWKQEAGRAVALH